MVFGWGDSEDAYNKTYTNGQPNEAKFSHELIAGGASFAAFKAFEDHQRAEGKTVDHAFAKELLAGFAGAEVDKLAETKGMDEYDKIEAKRHAQQNTQTMYDQHYQENLGASQYNPDAQPPPPQLEKHRHKKHNG